MNDQELKYFGKTENISFYDGYIYTRLSKYLPSDHNVDRGHALLIVKDMARFLNKDVTWYTLKEWREQLPKSGGICIHQEARLTVVHADDRKDETFNTKAFNPERGYPEISEREYEKYLRKRARENAEKILNKT